MSGSQLLLLGGTPQVVSDPNFEYTTLLLPGNGTNGAQNNTFLDSSTNAFTITRNGNTTQGTFSPFSQTGWGNYFDGNADYLTVASNAAFGYGTGDFTIEMWIYPTVIQGASTPNLFDQRTANPQVVPTIYLNNGQLIYYVNGLNRITGATLTANQWYHIAVCRASGSTRMFLNGTQTGSTYADANNYITSPITIFTQGPAAAIYQEGYCSNLRIVKGIALYTAAFTPPTTPLTAISGTSLLTCQSNRFRDASTNNFTITRNGDVSVQAFSPFNPTAAWSAATYGGSGYFDGSGDYLTLNGGTPLTFGTGDFTIEFWYYSNNSGVQHILYDGRPAGTNGIYVTIFKSSGNVLELFVNNAVVISGATAVNATSWNHVALSRSGTSTKLFLNGVQQGSTYTDSNNYLNGTSRPAIGSDGATIGNLPLNGYLSDLRVLKGTALYTAAFTPPTAPLTAIANTQLLLSYTNAGIYDATSKNDLETVGNAQISTTQSKFGGSSMYFDGTGDYLLTQDSPNLNYGAGDFTAEAWVYPAASPNQPIIVGQWDGVGGGTGLSWVLLLSNDSNRYLRFALSTNGSGVLTDSVSSSALTLNAWNHVALVRYGSVFTAYLNGVSAVTYTISAGTALYDATNRISVGSSSTNTQNFNGYIDDLRITKGVARYTANFTAPTAAFPLL